MAVQLTIRNVPESVRDELAVRAARNHQSMQEYLLSELQRLARKPTVESWLAKVRERKEFSDRGLSADSLLRHRDADRR